MTVHRVRVDKLCIRTPCSGQIERSDFGRIKSIQIDSLSKSNRISSQIGMHYSLQQRHLIFNDVVLCRYTYIFCTKLLQEYDIACNMRAVADQEVLDGMANRSPNSTKYAQKCLSLVHIFVTILHIFVI